MAPPRAAFDAGEAGASATKEHQRRAEARRKALDDKWGRFGGVVEFFTDEPQSTQAWSKGAIGERRLASSLSSAIAGTGVLLHDRRVPNTKGNIDHLAIVPSGVWVIDAKNYKGTIERRVVGLGSGRRTQLMVAGRDKTKLATSMTWQLDAVRRVLDCLDAPVHGALCFIEAEWGWFAKPFTVEGILVAGLKGLGRALVEPGPLTREHIADLTLELGRSLPASR